MRLINLIAALATAFVLMTSNAGSAEAGGIHRAHPPAGWVYGHHHVVRYRYRPRHRYHAPTHSYGDRHRYRYEPRGYYPYYNSRYWKPRRYVYRPRYNFHHPRYRGAWGRHKRHYHHRSWHNRHHGRHRFWHW
ncbi:MAG: hypothetical protein AAFY64_00485 [Pseudomonadota bacterium]